METLSNKGRQPQRIAERLMLLRDYLNANASKTRAVSMKNMQIYLRDCGDIHGQHLPVDGCIVSQVRRF